MLNASSYATIGFDLEQQDVLVKAYKAEELKISAPTHRQDEVNEGVEFIANCVILLRIMKEFDPKHKMVSDQSISSQN
jgi:hypothetical protein